MIGATHPHRRAMGPLLWKKMGEKLPQYNGTRLCVMGHGDLRFGLSDVVVVVQEISLLTSCCSDLPTWAVTHTLWWLIDSNFFHFFKRWRELQRTSPCTWQRTAASLWQVCPPTTWNIWPTPCTRSPSKRRSRSTLVQAVARGAFWYIHVTQVLQQRCNSSA